MSSYLTANISVGIRGFERTCHALQLHLPLQDTELDCAVIDEPLFKKYACNYRRLSQQDSLSQNEASFLSAYHVLHSLYVDWCIECEDTEGPYLPFYLIFS